MSAAAGDGWSPRRLRAVWLLGAGLACMLLTGALRDLGAEVLGLASMTAGVVLLGAGLWHVITDQTDKNAEQRTHDRER